MRMVFSALIGAATLASVVALDARPSAAQYAAQYYPYCARYFGRGDGGTSCYFSTRAQCRASVSGVGGICVDNPWYVEAHPPAYDRTYRHRRYYY
jgi:Protein of unknown function (DUF3551)